MNSKEALRELHKLLGEGLYRKVTATLRGTTVYFPYEAEWSSKEERNERIRQDYYSGIYEVGDLAKKYDLSISRIYKIIQAR